VGREEGVGEGKLKGQLRGGSIKWASKEGGVANCSCKGQWESRKVADTSTYQTAAPPASRPQQGIKLRIGPHANQSASPPYVPHSGKFRWLCATRSTASVGKLDLNPWYRFLNTDGGGSEHPTTFRRMEKSTAASEEID
jgi:hypothetical protein